jgi:hypothetical protein
MIDAEKALLFQAAAVAVLLIVAYGSGLCLLIAGVLLLPWPLAKIACGLALAVLAARLTAAYYVLCQP